MELEALSGLRETLARTRPTILIEVDYNNTNGFTRFCKEQNYEITLEFPKMRFNQNFLLKPL